MSRLRRLAKQKFTDEMIGSHNGQSDNVLTIYEDDKPVGSIQYCEYKGQPFIQMIEVPEEYRRKGYATSLLKELQRNYPNEEIDWGMTTDDGTGLKQSITYEVENTEVSKLINELKDAQNELNEIDKRIDDGDINDADGDRWNELYDKIRELEKEIGDQKPTKTLIK